MRFEVKVQRTVVQTTVVDVEARSEEFAADKAIALVERNPDTCEWELESDDLDVLEVIEQTPDEDEEE